MAQEMPESRSHLGNFESMLNLVDKVVWKGSGEIIQGSTAPGFANIGETSTIPMYEHEVTSFP